MAHVPVDRWRNVCLRLDLAGARIDEGGNVELPVPAATVRSPGEVTEWPLKLMLGGADKSRSVDWDGTFPEVDPVPRIFPG